VALTRILPDLPGTVLHTGDGGPARSAGDRERLEGGVARDSGVTVTTKLDGGLRRELLIGQEPYTLTLSEEGLSLVFEGAIGRRLLDLAAFPRTTVRTLASRLGPHRRIGNTTRIAP
jgi:hypothetical protein